MPLPFTYLDFPIGTNLRKRDMWEPIVLKFERKLSTWKHKLLSFAGRLCLISSIALLSLFLLSSSFSYNLFIVCLLRESMVDDILNLKSKISNR